MKLVINIFFPEGQLNKAKEKLKSYKYRDDVIWPDRLADAEMPGIMASAYGMLFFSSSAGSALPVMEVMQSGVPVILNDTAAGIAEIAGDAGLYVDPADPGAVAQQMIRLYKDETLRTRLIREGENRTASFSWDNTTDVMWDNLEKTVSSFQPVQSGSI
jgi:glycosyltransferase involved in cell wall biosynthesis